MFSIFSNIFRHESPRLQLPRRDCIGTGLFCPPLGLRNPQPGGIFGHESATGTAAPSDAGRVLPELEHGRQRSLRRDPGRRDTGERSPEPIRVETDSCKLWRGRGRGWLPSAGWLSLSRYDFSSCGMLNTSGTWAACLHTCQWSEGFPGNSSYSAGVCEWKLQRTPASFLPQQTS